MRHFYLHQREQSGIWYVTFTNPLTGKLGIRRSTKTTNKRKAESQAQEWLREGIPDIPQSHSIIFCDYLNDFWNRETSNYYREIKTLGKDPKPRHFKDMQSVVRRYFLDYFKKQLLGQVDEMNLHDFLVYLRLDKGLAPSTVNQARNAAFVALKYAKRRKLIRNFDFDAVLRVSGKTKDRGILEREEVDELFIRTWRDPRSRLMNLIASQTGMRMGEIQALRICDIHQEAISIVHSWNKVDGGLKSTKNNECRTVPILPELTIEIQTYIKQYRKTFRTDSFLFPSNLENTPYDDKQVRKDFYSTLKEIGISEVERRERNIVFHSWRHYCAKNLAQVANRAIGMAILGHKTSAMFDHYADHADKETFKKMAQAIKEGLRPGLKQNNEIQFQKPANV
ncbi:site-specific integrase [Treponema sp. OttesenSCG-928-L16]|nr:site-specific integrase [Treponema sp. OttesenSCG-928-L16]